MKDNNAMNLAPNTVTELLPSHAEAADLIGRVFDPQSGGPCVVVIDSGYAVDITDLSPTVSTLFEREDLLDLVARGRAEKSGRRRWELTSLVDTFGEERNDGAAYLLSPVDLQVIKAAGVTFVESMIERVIEERAGGDSARAASIREKLADVIGGAISQVKPGSEEAARVKDVLQRENLWSQYLEVGIGPDPEIFTKAPVLSSVGTGQAIGVHSESSWNNPEPEVVFAVRSDGAAIGATLGNDVNLRDVEGRSALLLAEAKDNNASCAIGPFIRLFDENFNMDDTRSLEIELRVDGTDGFSMTGSSSMRKISRDPLELISHTVGDHHQYPDGFVLFTGTLFSPTTDRLAPGAGFTHLLGDVVRISNPKLGMLTNTVMHSESAPRWETGIWTLMSNLRDRQLL